MSIKTAIQNSPIEEALAAKNAIKKEEG